MDAQYEDVGPNDVGSDDEDQSIYPEPTTSYPYFQTADPALRAAYGDPTGGYQYPDPTELYGGSVAPRSPHQVHYDEEEAEEDVYDEEEPVDQSLSIAQALANLNDPRTDPDYQSPIDEGEQDSPTDDDDNDDDDDSDSDSEHVAPRGRGRGRGGRVGRPRGRGRGRGTYATAAAAPRARGRGRPRGRPRGRSDGRRGAILGRKHGPRAMAEPTAEFKNYNALMNKAYIAEDFDEALRQGLEAVKANPEMFHVHATIAEILLRKGRREDALGALYVGVHATRDEGSWWYVIEKLIDLGSNSKETKHRLQDCYSSLLDMNPENYKARLGRMKNYMATGQKTRARNECLNLVQRNPFDVEAMQVLADISFSVEEPAVATPAFSQYFERSTAQGAPDDVELAWKLLDIYMDLLVHCSEWEVALHKLRPLARWILNRSEEAYWDSYEDDREWDLDDEPRRTEVDEFEPGLYPLESYGEGLPIELREKIGLIRLGMGTEYHAEALDHFEFLEPSDESPEAYVYEYPDLFREIGDALREEDLHQDALRFYEPIQRQTQGIDSRFYFDIAICYQALGQDENVKKTMEALRLFKRGARDANFYVGLAKLYESQGREKDMHYLIRQLKRMGKSDLVLAAGLPLPRENTRPARGQTVVDEDSESPISREGSRVGSEFRQIRARSVRLRKDKRIERQRFRERVVRNLYDQLLELNDGLANQDAEAVLDWTNIADQLLDEFRAEKIFFPRERATRFTGYDRWQRTVIVPEGDAVFRESTDSEKEVPQHFCDIHFDEWLDVLLQLALQHARNGLGDNCWEIMKTIQTANIFLHEPERMQKKRNVSLACALLLEDEKQLIEEARWFIKQYPYTADSYRLFSAMNRFCRGPITYYNSGPEQKFVLRAVKAMDFSLLPPEHRSRFGFTDGDRAKWTEPAPETGNPHKLTEHDPTLLTLYGHMMFVAATYSSALTYYFRAYVLRPNDPVLNLCIAIAYIQMGYKRQAENRQYQIQQGFSFLRRYYDLRTADGIALKMQEAEFNVALAYHTLGLQHLALPAYERCIELSGRVQSERLSASLYGERDDFVEDLAAEAAFAIQGILALGGDFAGARQITAKHLVL